MKNLLQQPIKKFIDNASKGETKEMKESEVPYIGMTGNMEYDITVIPTEDKFDANMGKIYKVSMLSVDLNQASFMRKSGFAISVAGNGFNHTSQLKVMKYTEAIVTDEAD
eukprot:14833532-Ditylum_brightwellii.AAC.1